MAKLPYRSKTKLGYPAARTPVDPFDPDSVNPNEITDYLEVNKGETTSEETIDRTEIVKQKHSDKFKRENKQ